MGGPTRHHLPIPPEERTAGGRWGYPTKEEAVALHRRRDEQKRLLDEAVAASREAREHKAPPFVTMQSAPLSVPFTPAYIGYRSRIEPDHFVSDNGIKVRVDQMKDLTAQMQDVSIGLLYSGDRKNEGWPYGEISTRRLGVWQRFLLWLFGEPAQKQLPDHQVRTFIIARQGFGGRGKQERTA